MRRHQRIRQGGGLHDSRGLRGAWLRRALGGVAEPTLMTHQRHHPAYVEVGLLSGISDLSTFVPFLSAFFIAFLSFFSFFFSSFFLPMLFVPCHLRYGLIHKLF